MSKELEAFYKVKDKLIKVEGNTTYGSITDLTNLDIIETFLKDIDKIMSNYNCSDLSELNEKLYNYEQLKF